MNDYMHLCKILYTCLIIDAYKVRLINLHIFKGHFMPTLQESPHGE